MRARAEEDARVFEGRDAILRDLGERCVVLVGMPGAGKSSIGRRLAARLGIPFVDADAEIEKAAGMSIPDIFATHGEAAFRDGERRVIARLLAEGPAVLATGGGAFMNPETRAAVKARGVSVWLRADLDTLHARVRRRTNRPLLAVEDPRARLARLMEEREPVFALADIAVRSADAPHDNLVREILAALAARAAGGDPAGGGETIADAVHR